MGGITLFTTNGGGGSAPVSGIATVSNGLTPVGTDGQLGGPLTSNVTIDVAGHALEVSDSVNTAVSLQLDSNPVTPLMSITAGNAAYLGGIQMTRPTGGGGSGTFMYCNNAAGQQALNLNGTTMIVVDSNAQRGLINSSAYEANFVPKSLITLTYLQSALGNFPLIIAGQAVSGVTTSAAFSSVIFGGSGKVMMRVSAYIIINSFTAGSISLQIDYTDENNNPQTFVFGTLVAVGASSFAPYVFSMKLSTFGNLSYTITGTLIASVGYCWEKLF